MRLYCFDILAGIAIGMVTLITGGIVYSEITDDPVERQLQMEGYTKTNYSYEQLMYTDFEECVEHNNKFYCY